MRRINVNRMLAAAVVVLAVLGLAGCAGMASRKPPIEIWDDMDRQPKYKAQQESTFFADARASRMPVA